MSIRKKPARNRNRKDPSLPVFPPIAGVTATLVGGSINLEGDVPLVVSKLNPTDLSIVHGGTVGTNIAAYQVDEFNVALKASNITTVDADDVLTIGSQMTGIRSSRGGMLQIGQYTF